MSDKSLQLGRFVRIAAVTPDDLSEQIAKIIDPEAFGLDGMISDRDTARDRARLILTLLHPEPVR